MKLIIDVRWDDEALVWYALSRGKTGLATEPDSLDGLRQRILAVVPDLLDVKTQKKSTLNLSSTGFWPEQIRLPPSSCRHRPYTTARVLH